MDFKDLKLSLEVQKPSELRKLLRELDNLKNTLQERRLRQDQSISLHLSTKLAGLFKINNLNYNKEEDIVTLEDFLKNVEARALFVHFSFNQSPNEQFLTKLTDWLRNNIDPQVLITVGITNDIGVGFILRSTNKYFDFSLGTVLKDKRDILTKKIREVDNSVAN